MLGCGRLRGNDQCRILPTDTDSTRRPGLLVETETTPSYLGPSRTSPSSAISRIPSCLISVSAHKVTNHAPPCTPPLYQISRISFVMSCTTVRNMGAFQLSCNNYTELRRGLGDILNAAISVLFPRNIFVSAHSAEGHCTASSNDCQSTQAQTCMARAF